MCSFVNHLRKFVDKSSIMSSSEKRPILKIRFSKADFTLETVALLALITIWTVPVIMYTSLPDTIPTHFSLQGKADSWGSKSTIFLLPIISILLFAGLTILNKYPHTFNYPVKVTKENASQLYTKGTRMIRILKVIVVLLFLFIEILILRSVESTQLPTWFFLLVLLLPIVLPVVMAYMLTKKFSVSKNR